MAGGIRRRDEQPFLGPRPVGPDSSDDDVAIDGTGVAGSASGSVAVATKTAPARADPLIVLLGPLLASLLLIATGAILDVAEHPHPIVTFISNPSSPCCWA